MLLSSSFLNYYEKNPPYLSFLRVGRICQLNLLTLGFAGGQKELIAMKNPSGHAGGKSGASSRPRDRGEHPELELAIEWPMLG